MKVTTGELELTISEIPLLEGNDISITINELNDYKDLLTIKTDPNRVLFIRDIRIDIDDTTSLPQIKIKLNGTPYLTDFPLLAATTTFGFASDLKGRTGTPVSIKVKKTAVGAGTLTITCFVTGIQMKNR